MASEIIQIQKKTITTQTPHLKMEMIIVERANHHGELRLNISAPRLIKAEEVEIVAGFFLDLFESQNGKAKLITPP